MIITSPNPASKDWREPSARRSPSTPTLPTKFPRPRGPWADDPVVRLPSPRASLSCGFAALSSGNEQHVDLYRARAAWEAQSIRAGSGAVRVYSRRLFLLGLSAGTVLDAVARTVARACGLPHSCGRAPIRLACGRRAIRFGLCDR